jgi:hypothetical protein
VKYCSNGSIINIQTGWCNSSLAFIAAIIAVVVTVLIVALIPPEKY